MFSHSNPLALCKNRRNIDDEQIRAVADLVDDVDYLVDLIGPDQVGLGLDFR